MARFRFPLVVAVLCVLWLMTAVVASSDQAVLRAAALVNAAACAAYLGAFVFSKRFRERQLAAPRASRQGAVTRAAAGVVFIATVILAALAVRGSVAVLPALALVPLSALCVILLRGAWRGFER